jgi:hypothetical protein
MQKREATTPKEPNPKSPRDHGGTKVLSVLPIVAQAMVYNHENPKSTPKGLNRHEKRSLAAQRRKQIRAALKARPRGHS